MFLPSEAVYAELHANFGDLVREGFDLRVWIVSPTTCMATLNTLRAVLKDARLKAEAHAIRRELGLLYRDVERLSAAGGQPRPALRPGAEGHRGDPHLRRQGAGAGAAAGGDRLRDRRPRASCRGRRSSGENLLAFRARRGRLRLSRRYRGASPMAQLALDDYPGRYGLVNELHARPFPELAAPCRAAYLAIKQPENAADRDREADRAHLEALLDRYGAPHPPPGASHYSGPVGRVVPEVGAAHRVRHLHPLRRRRGPAALLGRDVRPLPGRLAGGGAGEGRDLGAGPDRDGRGRRGRGARRPRPAEVVRAGEPGGQPGGGRRGGDRRRLPHRRARAQPLRSCWRRPGIGQRRLGRIVQRLLEIETYKCMAMLTLPLAREVAVAVARIDRELTGVVAGMAAETGHEAETLDRLLRISAEIEHLASTSAFRFGAAGAYETIVIQRIAGAARGADRRAAALRRVHDPPLRPGDAHLPLGQGAAGGALGPGGAGGEPAEHAGGRDQPGAERRGAARRWTGGRRCSSACRRRSRGCRWWRSATTRSTWPPGCSRPLAEPAGHREADAARAADRPGGARSSG